ncbi:unnamed protein product, partial [Rotaria sp. Silwood1]
MGNTQAGKTSSSTELTPKRA